MRSKEQSANELQKTQHVTYTAVYKSVPIAFTWISQSRQGKFLKNNLQFLINSPSKLLSFIFKDPNKKI